MRKYDVYHSDAKGQTLFATSRSRKESAIKIASEITLAKGERVLVLQDKGDAPGDFKQIWKSKGSDQR